MTSRAALTLSILLLVGCLIAASTDQYGAAAWRILKTMMGTATCAEGSLCMFGGGEYYVDSFAGIQDALDNGCGQDVRGSSTTQSGCVINLTKGIYDNGGVTIHLAGTGTGATGRSGVTLRGTGGGTAAGTAGEPLSGTIIRASSGTVPIIDVGVCYGCTIENLTLAGEDRATAGIDILSPSGSEPTTRLVIRNVAMYEIDGFGIRTGTSGQVDTMIFENVSVRDSDGCYQQRDTQTIGAILINFDCSDFTSSGPVFDIVEGDFTLARSFLALKNNETGIRMGAAASRAIIEGNQLELKTSTSATLFSSDYGGGSTSEINATISNNHVIWNQNGNTLFNVYRKGTFVISGNSFQDLGGGKTVASTFKVANTNAANRLFVTLLGNMLSHNGSGGTLRPDRYLPTLNANTLGVYPTLQTPIISSPADPGDCMDGEIWVDSDAAAGSGSATKCLSNAWVAF